MSECPECGGAGWNVGISEACCDRSEYECGGRGCTGSVPMQVQEQCGYCFGSGQIEDSGEEIPLFDDAPKDSPGISTPIRGGRSAVSAYRYPLELCRMEARKRYGRISAYRCGLVAGDWAATVDPAEFPSPNWQRIYDQGVEQGAEMRRKRQRERFEESQRV